MELMRTHVLRNPSVTSILASVSGIGFLLHLAWEYVQCSPFFLHVKVPATISSMLAAATGDVFILWAAYVPVALYHSSLAWPIREAHLVSWLSFTFISMAITGVVEHWSITTGRWSYTESNPVFEWLGISVLPFAQMLILNPLTIWLNLKFFNWNQQPYTKEKER